MRRTVAVTLVAGITLMIAAFLLLQKEPKFTLISEDPKARAAELVKEGAEIELKWWSDIWKRSEQDAKKRAIKKYSEAIRLCPKCSSAYARRAMAYYFLNKQTASQTDALKAVELGHDDAHDYNFMSFGFEPEQRRKILRKGMQKSNRDAYEYHDLWLVLAKSYFYEGRFQQSADELEKLIDSMESSSNAALKDELDTHCHSLALSYEALGRYDEMEKLMHRALGFIEKSPPRLEKVRRQYAWSTIVRSRFYRNDVDGALTLVEDPKTPLNAKRRNEYRILLLGLKGLPSPSLERLTKMVTEGRGYYAVFCAGVALLETGAAEEGVSALQNFIKNPEARAFRGDGTMRWEINKAHELIERTYSVTY